LQKASEAVKGKEQPQGNMGLWAFGERKLFAKGLEMDDLFGEEDFYNK
jgi:hypothetical protein